MTKRIEWIDIAKGIGIILVVIGHISQIKVLNNAIYSFHMPLFFILSGYLYKRKEKFTKSKLKKILIPYLVFASISFLYWVLIERHMREQDISPIKAGMNIFLARGGDSNYIFNVVLWFLPCLFMTENIFYILERKFTGKTLFFIILSSSFIGFLYPKVTDIRLPFCLDIVFLAIVFYYIGYELRKYIETKFIKKFNKNNLFISIQLLICIAIIIGFSIFEDGANMNNLKIKYYSIFFLTAIIGSYAIYLIANAIARNRIKSDVLKFIGKNSLYIMCVHEPIKRVVLVMMSKAINLQTELMRKDILWIFICLCIVIAVSSFVSLIIDRIKCYLKYKVCE